MPADDALALRNASAMDVVATERPPPRARVVVRDETGLLRPDSPRRFLWPIETFQSVLDVRRAIRRVIFGADADVDAVRAVDVALDVDGYALVDECACARVVRDGDVVTATTTAAAVGSRGDVVIERAHGGVEDVWRKPLAPDVSDEEGEEGGVGNSRSARRKSRKRAKRRTERETAGDVRNESASGEGEGEDDDEEDRDAGRREKKTRLIGSGTTARRPYEPEPIGDYPAKPKPLRPEDYVHLGETCHADPASRMGVVLERRRQHEAAVRASGENAWEMFVFRSEMPDEEVEEFPLVTSLKRSDFIAYKIHHGSGVKSPYYQGRVMEFNPATRVVRVRPAPNERSDEAGRLHFKVRLQQPAPFQKLGELEQKWNPFDDDDSMITDVRLIGGRSVWNGDIPSKTWTSGRKFIKPPGWQPGQRETKEQHEQWLDEHIEIHRYQMANSRKWDEEIAQRDREFRQRDNSGRRRPHRHERRARPWEDDQGGVEEPENNDAHIWPTSAEELQARLLAEWNAAQDNRRVEESARLDEKTFARASLVDDAAAPAPDASRASSRLVLEDAQAAAAAAVGGTDVERGEGDGGERGTGDADACGTCRTRIDARKGGCGGGAEWTACEVAWARSSGVCALVAHGKVYDASAFLRKHPSGEAPILRALGRDNTEDFEMHSVRARGVWEEHRIGRLIRCDERGYGDFAPPSSLTDACVVQ